MSDIIQIDNFPITDQFSVPPFNEGIKQNVALYMIPHGLSKNLPSDIIRLELRAESGVVEAREMRLSDTPYIQYKGKLRIDALGIVGDIFGRTKGSFTLRISAFRNLLPEEFPPPKNLKLSQHGYVRVSEVSSTGNEIRVKATPKVLSAFDDFRANVRPDKVLSGQYWMYDKSFGDGTVYYEDEDKGQHAFSSEEEYFEHRKDRGYPADWEGISIKDENDEYTYEAVLHSDKGIWPVTLRTLTSGKNGRPLDLQAINWLNHGVEQKDGSLEDTIIFRLGKSAPTSVRPGALVKLIRNLIIPFEVPVHIDIPQVIEDVYEELRGPNLRIPAESRTGHPTDIYSFNDLIGSNSNVQNKIINAYLSSSDTITINNDYRSYNTFVHFGSAEERLKTFKYKLEQIEYYVSKSEAYSTQMTGLAQSAATGSYVMVQNKAEYDSKKQQIIGSFDGYEKYLYFESHSTEQVYTGNRRTKKGITRYNPSTWPKSTALKPHSLIHTTGSEAVAWYTSQLESASFYDQNNSDALRYTVPVHITSDTANVQWIKLYDMLGHFFDTFYNQVEAFENMTNREESIYEGLSKDLLIDSAKALGWDLYSGVSTAKLWEYLLGTDEDEGYQASGSGDILTYVRRESYSHEDAQKQIWKRILNNIPHLLKTKGTKEGVESLLRIYGIPNTILRVEEFGGPVTEKSEYKRKIKKFQYQLNCSGSSEFRVPNFVLDTGSADLNFTNPNGSSTGRRMSMWEMRFKIDQKNSHSMHIASDARSYPLYQPTNGPRMLVYLEHSSSAAGWDSTSAKAAGSQSMLAKYGRLHMIVSGGAPTPCVSASTNWEPFYDGDWWNITWGTSEYLVSAGTNTGIIRYAKASEHADGKITHSGSAQTGLASSNVSQIYGAHKFTLIGTGSNDLSQMTHHPVILGFTGSIQEFRGWAEYITDNAFYQHALAPTSIVGDSVQMAYNDLVYRFPFGTDLKRYNNHLIVSHSSTGSVPNINFGTTDAMWLYSGGASDQHTRIGSHGWPVNTDSTAYNYTADRETYYVSVPNTLGARPHSNKIRIEDNEVRNNLLSRLESFESSSYDTNALDSHEITIALSPQDQIDTDIAMQFGDFDLADYIGDARDNYQTFYTSLRDVQNYYFKKYSGAYNIWAFIKLLKTINVGLFKQLESMIPARADARVGIEIRPNLLERHKVVGAASMSQMNTYYTSSVEETALHEKFSGDIPSLQTYKGSSYSNYVSTIEIGVRSSQQGASGSDTYINRFIEGSEIYNCWFGEVTASDVMPFVSSSAITTGSKASLYNYNPVFSSQNASVSKPRKTGSYSMTDINASAVTRSWVETDISPSYFSSNAQRRLVYEGTRMTSAEFNVSSIHTLDGKPVVEYKLVNPNIIQMEQDGYLAVR